MKLFSDNSSSYSGLDRKLKTSQKSFPLDSARTWFITYINMTGCSSNTQYKCVCVTWSVHIREKKSEHASLYQRFDEDMNRATATNEVQYLTRTTLCWNQFFYFRYFISPQSTCNFTYINVQHVLICVFTLTVFGHNSSSSCLKPQGTWAYMHIKNFSISHCTPQAAC